MKATNTFFTHKEYTTHTSYLPPSLPQMLDIFSISSFKRIRDCALSNIGIPSDQAAICLRLAISTIAHTGGTKLAKSQIDWVKIMNDEGTKQRFNNRLTELNAENTPSYSPFFF